MLRSLVGSEMCIRDRFQHATVAGFAARLIAMADGQHCSAVVHDLPQIAPVSYTHLTLPTIYSV